MNKTNRVVSYIGTVYPDPISKHVSSVIFDECTKFFIDGVKRTVKYINDEEILKVKRNSKYIPRFVRMTKRGRFGKNNPNRSKYSKNWANGWCRLEDAQRIDIYIQYDGMRSHAILMNN